MELKATYKNTEIGRIPMDWEVKKLGEVAPFQRGFDLTNPSLVSGKYPVVYSNGIVNYHNKFQAKSPGVVTGRSGTIGKVHFIQEDYWPHNTSLWVTDFKGNVPLYIFYLYTNIKFNRFSTGSGVPTLNRNDLHDFRVALPPTKAEQTAIATALNDADALITQLEKLIAKKRNIKQGAMQKCLNYDSYDYDDLREHKKESFNQINQKNHSSDKWEVKKLGEIGEVKMCRRVFNHETSPNGAIPFYKIGTFGKEADSYISRDLYNDYRRKFSFPNKGDILISAAGTIGRTIIYDGEDAYFQDSNIVWIENNQSIISNTFLYYTLQIVEYNTEGGTIQRLYNSILKNTKFICPTPEIQTQIAQTLSDMDTEIAGLEKQLEKYKRMKVGMMQNLLTGKIRLV
jgi:type I restriction enzyme, S subunit